METRRQTNEGGENRARRKTGIENEGGRRNKAEGRVRKRGERRVRKRDEGSENADGQH